MSTAVPFEEESPDPGLAAERTDLAWNRSGLSLLACGVAAMRGLSLPHLSEAHLAVGITILALGAVVWLLGGLQARRRARAGHVRERASTADLAPIAFGTAAVGVAAFVLGAFYPG